MLKKLSKDHEMIASYIHGIFNKVEKANDEATYDLLVRRLACHDKMAWMLKSSLAK